MKKNILLSTVTLIAVLTFLEIILRVAWENNEWWAEEKNDAPYTYPINRYGPGMFDYVRDLKYDKEKPRGTVRIICVGDSFTYGDGVKFDDTYAKRLERSLNYLQGRKTGKKYEVLNMSWCGFSTFQEINQLPFIKEFHPDLILWGYCLNDTEDWTDPDGVQLLRYKLIYKHEPKKYLKFIYKNSYLSSFIGNRLSNLRISGGNKKYYKYLYEDSYPGWIRVQKSFEILRNQDTPIIVLVFPLLAYDLNKGYPFLEIHEKLRRELERDRLTYIDFYDTFRKENPIRLQAVPYKNPHPSEIAHRIIEETVYKKLTSDYESILK